MHRRVRTATPVEAAARPGSAIVFIGSSVRVADLAGLDSRVVRRPPVRRGDVPAALAAGYRTIAIVDGEFYQSLAVSPKEVLAALRSGCRVVGGASMGALRGAELAVHGMECVGVIADWYRRGVVTRDDDVALSYAHDEDDYRPLTIPMVNIRWLGLTAKREGWIGSDSRRRLSLAGRRIHWEQRTWRRVAAAARLTPSESSAGALFLANPDNDLKRLDALRTLRRVEQIVDRELEPALSDR